MYGDRREELPRDDRTYEAPAIESLGTLEELTLDEPISVIAG